MKNFKIFCTASLIVLCSLAEAKPAGILLEGPPNYPAVQALKDYLAPRSPTELEIGHENGNGYYRQLLKAIINPKATVAQVNTALNSVGARLSFSRPGSGAVTLTVSEPLDLDGLRKLGGKLVESGAFTVASPSYVPGVDKITVGPGANIPVTGDGILKAFKNSSKRDSKK